MNFESEFLKNAKASEEPAKDIPFVSFVIVSWNARRLVLSCLKALHASQTGYNTEIIIVDNGSTDGTVAAISNEFPKVRLILNGGNLGFAKANNIGIRASSGQYVCLMNSDIAVGPSCVEYMVSFMKQNPRVGILGAKLLKPDLGLCSNCRELPSIWNNLCYAIGLNRLFPKVRFFSSEEMLYFAHDKTKLVQVIAGSLLMVRREALNEVGLFDEGFFFYGEDADFCKRFADAGWQIVFYPEAQAIHHHAGSSKGIGDILYLQRHKSKLQYWSKHHGALAVFAIKLIMLVTQGIRLCFHAFLGRCSWQDSEIHKRRAELCIKCIRLLALGEERELSRLYCGRDDLGETKKGILDVNHTSDAMKCAAQLRRRGGSCCQDET